MNRIGPQMSAAVAYVSRNPGTAIMPVGEHLGFTRNRGYGYDPVHRAIRAGLIVARAGKGNAYALYTPAGWQAACVADCVVRGAQSY